MKSLRLLEEQFSSKKLTKTQLSVIKGGDDKRGGFPGGGPKGTPPPPGTHSTTFGL
jgi:hypothetical protein